MRRLQIKFPNQIRISGWDFGSSARAMNQVGGYISTQAELEKVSNSTTERKIMSIKTSIKRVALVAVAALGFGVLSTVPSNAATGIFIYHGNSAANGNCNVAGNFACWDYTADTSWVTTNQVATYGYQQTYLAGDGTDYLESTWSLASAVDSTGAVIPGYQVPALVLDKFNGNQNALDAWVGNNPFSGGFDNDASWGFQSTDAPWASQVTNDAAANGTTTLNGFKAKTAAAQAGGTIGNVATFFTPTVAGTYVFTLTTTGGVTHTWTINAYATAIARDLAKVVAAGGSATPSSSTTTSIIGIGDANPGNADVVVTAAKAAATAATQAKATIKVTAKNSAGTDISAATVLSATISGPGVLAIGAGTGLAAQGRALTATQAGMKYVQVFSDGNAGTATITISSGTTVLSTETVVFFDTATKYVVDAAAAGTKYTNSIGPNATIAGVAKYLGVGEQQWWQLNTQDSAGNTVTKTPALTITIADPTILEVVTPGNGIAAVKGLKAGTTTFTVTEPTLKFTLGPVSVTVTDVAASSGTLTLDKDSYAPGEAFTLTITAKDASGKPLADGIYGTWNGQNGTYMATLSTSNLVYATGGGLIDGKYAPKFSDGVATIKGFMPNITGDVTFTLTLNGAVGVATAAAGAALTATASSRATSADAIDAANEATDAANAATDAANAAAEAADAATAAAQDAQAAVAELATQVAALIAGIKAQITTLTNLVIKIQKKVKA